MKINDLIKKVYILIPIFCFIGWAFLSLLKDNFYIYNAVDFDMLYAASRDIYLNPGNVYSGTFSNRYFYAPAFATVYGIIVLIFSFEISIWILFFTLLIFGILTIIEFDKLLKLLNFDEPLIRFAFLIVIANGHSIMINFDFMQTKLFVTYFLVLFLRREIQHRKASPDPVNSNKFVFWQMMIFIFAIGLVPQYAPFFIIVYLFHKIPIKDIFKKNQVKRYGFLVLAFLIQNFMIFIILIANPRSILSFLEGFIGHGSTQFITNISTTEIISEKITFPMDFLSLLTNSIILIAGVSIVNEYVFMGISLTILIILVLIITFHNNLRIEEKFGYIAFFSLLFSIFYHGRDRVILIPLAAILFIANIKQEESFFKFLKKNYIWIIGLTALLLLNLYPRTFFLLTFFIFLQELPIGIVLLMVCSVYLILGVSIFALRKDDFIYIFKKEPKTE